ncbi:hypothetical protein P7K49_017254 [Saguinus oedipus]|uniref:Uncharacterized protein n=1 Tax=Saguinus oedipus TaxID=9490 RepID=A0ABQ9V1Y3_SAGOE|nr:hypothetical protein P7K49_017254 [Saguinus oedipus]
MDMALLLAVCCALWAAPKTAPPDTPSGERPHAAPPGPRLLPEMEMGEHCRAPPVCLSFPAAPRPLVQADPTPPPPQRGWGFSLGLHYTGSQDFSVPSAEAFTTPHIPGTGGEVSASSAGATLHTSLLSLQSQQEAPFLVAPAPLSHVDPKPPAGPTMQRRCPKASAEVPLMLVSPQGPLWSLVLQELTALDTQPMAIHSLSLWLALSPPFFQGKAWNQTDFCLPPASLVPARFLAEHDVVAHFLDYPQ